MCFRVLIPLGALASGIGTQAFPLASRAAGIFASRALHGLGLAGVTPPLLGVLAQVTAHEPAQRARVMSFFELSLLAGLALGGVAEVNSGRASGLGPSA